MEATAVSLARSVLDGVLSSAWSAVADEVARLLGVPREVEFIRNELEMMRSFLQVASAHPGRTDTVRTWVKQVRDLAYDVEDCLLDFALYATRTSSSRAGSWHPAALAERRRIADRIRDLKHAVEELNKRNQRYNIAVDNLPAETRPREAEEQAAATSSSAAARTTTTTLPPDNGADNAAAELAFQESEIIGRHHEKTALTRLISMAPEPPVDGQGEQQQQQALLTRTSSWWSMVNSRMGIAARPLQALPSFRRPSAAAAAAAAAGGALRVVSVYGMGGMGKSSLVWMVHNDPVLLDEFDIGAWVTVPHPLDNPEVFRRRLRKDLGLPQDHNLELYLRDKRFRVVVDDLLTLDEWEHVRRVFAFDNNKGSRIIVTTRREDVARHCAREGNVLEGRELVYKLASLGSKESMNLLCRKVYKTTEYTLPDDMEEQAKLILSRCHGLPLAISTIGGLLANRPKTSIEWRNLHEHLGAVLESDLRDITNVIDSSYDGLPYHLKSIFLYLSIFPDNYEIRRNRLLRRWMAEGYIVRNRNMPVETVGERFYGELINRSMIQPSKVNPGDVITDHCRVHSMMRHIILTKSIEENQLLVIEKHSYEVPQSKVRHLVVSSWKGRDEKIQDIDLSYVRSLTIFGEYPASLVSPEMRLLRVLDLEDTANLKTDDLRHIGELQHLRYLSLRGTEISKIPFSLQNLRYLETLDIQDTRVTQLPGGVAKLKKLRYLIAGINFTKDLLQKMRDPGRGNHEASVFGRLCYNCECCSVFNLDLFSLRAPEGIEKLKNLHMLGVVNVGNGSGVAGRLRKLSTLTNLQRLGVTGLTENEGTVLCTSIGELKRLQQLELRSDSLRFLGRWDELLVPKHLVSMRLCGNLTELPRWFSSLNTLAEVKLLGTRLTEERGIEFLQNLRNLALLGLWENSYVGRSLDFSSGTFPKLKFLDIEGLDQIRKVKIMDGAMPELEQLWVNKCPSLNDDSSGLSGVPYLLNLNELLLKKCGDKSELINILQGQVNRHKKRPKFLIGRSINLMLPTIATEQ